MRLDRHSGGCGQGVRTHAQSWGLGGAGVESGRRGHGSWLSGAGGGVATLVWTAEGRGGSRAVLVPSLRAARAEEVAGRGTL